MLIAGPTASGKSALALRLAAEIGAEIVNADALQIYRDLSVLTARPSAQEEAAAPHHLFGVVDAAEAWSVGRWQAAALETLAAIATRGRPAVLVGGTGLYFSALTRGLADIPAVSHAQRDASTALFDQLGEAAFRDLLAPLDPVAEARIMAGDRQRLGRAHAVAVVTGRSLSAWQADTAAPLAAEAWRGVVLEPDRAVLYDRCDARLQTMLDHGALDEVAALAARGLDPALPALKAVGYRQFADHLDGRLSLDEALDAARQETRRYAKRQMTWFRNQTPDWPRIDALDGDGQFEQLTARFGTL
ncbi:MAG: tRNA ((37)-N6)-dimethylallyltransferase MiaA [Caulobacter sp.]|nr:tRNA ((37)-N6)-dimethylallyltransferase MiaA [Caulobacter sp.]